jgi:hemerythrin-like domain-containing protein
MKTQQNLDITQSFLQNYHEKLEEDYLFPIFEKRKIDVNLVKTLKNQHVKGRKITTKLKKMVQEKNCCSTKNKKTICSLLHQYIDMYRPHEAREDTVLFPQLHKLLTPEKLTLLGETFEEKEHELFGENGFQSTVNKVASIEKKLGIYQLEQFTPKI